MRVLVTGACGLLGAHLLERLSRLHQAIGTDRHPWWGDIPRQVAPGDLQDSTFLRKLLQEVHPEIVFHCAALTDVDTCERNPGAAFAFNAQLPGAMVRMLPASCRFVYLSTDAVFGGGRSLSTEDDTPSPVNVYGLSKLKGEELVQKGWEDSLIVRTNFYGWSSGRKKTFAEWLWSALEQSKPITLFEDFFFSPIYVCDLVERLEILMDCRCRGKIHLAGKDRVSKSQFGLQLAREASLETKNVRMGSVKQAGFAASRGGDLSLDSSRFFQLTQRKVPGYLDGLRRFVWERGKPLSQRLTVASATEISS